MSPTDYRLSRRRWLLVSSAAGVPAWFWPAAALAAEVGPATASAPASPVPGPNWPVMLAGDARPGIDPAGFLVSEKFDGVRAIWDGQALRFRSGRLIAVPAWFTAGWPAQPMDGELWLERGRFQALSGIVRRETPDEAAWRSVRYQVFDLPGSPEGYAARAARLQAWVPRLGQSWVQAVPQRRVADAAELQRLMASVVRGGGEGLMLHRADALWQAGRSEALLKLKPLHDAEAVVIGHEPGQGKHAGRLGALRVRTPDGVSFRLGTGFSDEERASPPPVGSWVTYAYQGLTESGRPRFARFLRLRDDV